MNDKKSAPITSQNLGQAIKRLSQLHVWFSSLRASCFVASMLSFLLSLFLIFNLVVGICVPPEELSDLDPFPFLRSAAAFSIAHMNKLPSAWYVRLAVSLLVLFVPMFILYHLTHLILFPVLSKRPGRLVLPSKTIPKAKKLYKTACVLCDTEYSHKAAIAAAVISGAAVFLLLIAGALSEYVPGENADYETLLVSILGFALIALILFFVYLWFYGTCLILSEKPVRKKQSEYFKQIIKLKMELHLYWQSVDPVEAERVEKERREQEARFRRSDSINWGVGLEIYEQYKRDAARSLGYSVEDPKPYVLTNEDHDDLDAAQRAARLDGIDFHTGV